MPQTVRQEIDKNATENPELIDALRDKSVLVTGATGSLGSYLVHTLMSGVRGGMIIAVARNETKARQMFSEYLSHEGFTLLISDVNNLNNVSYEVDYIIHAASPTQPSDFIDHPVDIITANVVGTLNLLTLAEEKKAKICLLSTLEVYGKLGGSDEAVVVSEDDFGSINNLDLRSAYPESKRLAEMLCLSFQEQYSVPIAIVRLAPVISPIINAGDKRVFAQFVQNALADKDIVVYSDIQNRRRSYTYIPDAVSGILTAMLGSDKETFVFNLANEGNVVSIKELAELILACDSETKSKLHIIDRENNQNTSSSTGRILLDSSRLSGLGWSPAYDLRAGIENIIKCQRS